MAWTALSKAMMRDEDLENLLTITPQNQHMSKHTALIPRKNDIVIPFPAREKR
jgi:hypothetical protein